MRISQGFKASFLLFLACTSALLGASSSMAQNQVSRKLLVTAYYSPLPDQSFYIRGSYEADIRLNGRGTNGADGTAVYPGMLAAPKSYPFGTRIHIPGLGVGEVHDRGGAILEREDYDRIDVWMGHGEEGLARALNWGSRMVEGEVYFDQNAIEAGLDFSWVSTHLSPGYIAQLQAKMEPNDEPTPEQVLEENEEDFTSSEEQVLEEASEVILEPTDDLNEVELSSVIKHSNDLDIERLQASQSHLKPGLAVGDEGQAVTHLQKTLWELGYFSEALTEVYDENTEMAVLELQLDQGVISSANSPGAGRFGPKTFEVLGDMAQSHVVMLDEHKDSVQTWVPAKNEMPTLLELTVPDDLENHQRLAFVDTVVLPDDSPSQYIAFSHELDVEDSGDAVVQLQTFLIAEGYLASGLNTGYYGEQTQAAVLQFQLAQGVVSSQEDNGAGRVGPKTLQMINRMA